MYGKEAYEVATDFFQSIITEEDILPVEGLLKRIQRAPSSARDYLERKCRDLQELEEFFKDNEHLFYVDNHRVALYREEYEVDVEKAVKYFEERLRIYGRPVQHSVLKQHLDNAPPRICYYISRFYPCRDFKKFFKQRPNVFVYHKDKTIFLVEMDSVQFYQKRLEAQRGQKQFFLNFRGHIGHAPPHVQVFMNKYYLGDDFQKFLIKHSDVFKLDDELFVTLRKFNT